MLKAISWNTYIIMVSGATVAYYLVILSLFYRKELDQLLRLKSSSRFPPQEYNDPPLLDNDIHRPEILDKIDQVIEDGASRRFEKMEMVMAIRRVFRENSPRPRMEEQAQLNHYIIEKVNSLCSLILSETDLKPLWVNK